MAKTLKTVGTIVGGMVLIATGVGAAMGVNVLGMGIMSYTGSLTVGQLGMISAGTVATGMMLEKPVSTGAGSATDWTSNPDQPTPFAFGRVGASGKIIHRDEYGPDNRLQGIVSVYSGAGPIKGFVSYSADGVGITFASNGGTAIGKYNRQMWRSWRLGAQPDTALSLPTGLDGGAVMPGWGAAYRLSGKACELLTLQQDSKFSVYPSGEPKPLAVLEGIHGYDPRYDDTYPGGAGPCRYNDRSTYRYIDNAIIGALNWALGLKENGQVVGGIGASLSGVDLPAFVEAANIADANNWKVTAWPDSSEDVVQVLKQLLQAGGANYARHAGKISCISRAGPHASILTMTARDTAGPIELDTGASRFDRINTITPEFMSEAHGWKHVPASPVSFAAFVTEDGGKRSDRIKYRFVPSGSHAAQLAALDILDPREPFSGSVPLKPHMRQLKPGDCFTISEPGFLLDGVKCKVLNRSYNPNTGAVQVAFRSETAGKVELALGKTTTVPAYPSLTPADPTLVSPPLPEDWVIVPRAPGEDGVQVPIFDLSGVVSNSTATAIIVEYGPTDEGPWTQAYQGPPTVTNIPVDGLQPGAEYYVAIQYQRGSNYSERAVYGPYTAPGLVAGGLSPESPDWDTIRDLANGEAAAELIAEAEARQAQALADAKAALDAADAQLASGLAALDSALNGLGLEDIDGFAAYSGSVQTALDGKATNGSVSALTTRVNTAEGTLAAQNARLNTVEIDLAGSAKATDLAAISTRVATAEGVNAAQNTRLNTVESDVAGKASAGSVADLTAEMVAAREGSANLKARMTQDRQAVVDGLAGKASSSDLAAQSAQLVAQGAEIAAHTTRFNTVEADLAGKASASALTSVNSNLSNLTVTVNGHATRLTSVETDLTGKVNSDDFNSLTAIVGTKARIWRQGTDPVGATPGDLLFKTTDNNRLFVLTPTAGWIEYSDARIPILLADVSTHSSAIADLETGKASTQSVTNAESRANDAYARATTAVTTAAAADGKASAIMGAVLDVNGRQTGWSSSNNGTISHTTFVTDTFAVVPPANSGARFSFANGKIVITAANNVNVVELGLGVLV